MELGSGGGLVTGLPPAAPPGEEEDTKPEPIFLAEKKIDVFR
jgi:hypothetical protein